jgi:glycerol kinase
VPLTVVTGDQSAVPFAFGALDAATAYVNIGTGAFIQRALRDRLPDAQQLLVSVVWSDAEGVDYMLEGTVNGAGSALDWLAGREQLSLPELLAAGQAAIAAGLEPPLFLNGIGGWARPSGAAISNHASSVPAPPAHACWRYSKASPSCCTPTTANWRRTVQPSRACC